MSHAIPTTDERSTGPTRSAKRTGTLEPLQDTFGRRYYAGKVRLRDKTRTRVHIPEAKRYDKKAARKYVTWAQGEEDRDGTLYKAKLAGISKRSAAVVRPPSETCDAWYDAWEKSRIAKGLTSTRDNRSAYELHIRPALAKHVRDWTPEDMRALCRDLDGKVQRGEIQWKRARNVWATVTKMAADAVSSKIDVLRVRTSNPCDGVERPDTGEERTKEYLYPSEFLRFVSCAEVPLMWRRAVAQAIYLFPRYGEHRALRHADVDVEHGVIAISRALERRSTATKATKTGTTRRFNVEPNLLPLLLALRPKGDLSAPLAELPSDQNLARALRYWLGRAGVDRRELHETTATTKAITWHDLRATGLTWMAVRGDEPLKIMQRAGHTTFQTTQIYIRTAEAIRDGFGEVFPPLPACLVGGTDPGVAPGQGEPVSQRRPTSSRVDARASESDAVTSSDVETRSSTTFQNSNPALSADIIPESAALTGAPDRERLEGAAIVARLGIGELRRGRAPAAAALFRAAAAMLDLDRPRPDNGQPSPAYADGEA